MERTKIKVVDGMRFQHNPYDDGNEFVARLYDYYEDGKPIMCAVKSNCIYPLDEICLDEYIPMVDGVWVNEPCEYDY